MDPPYPPLQVLQELLNGVQLRRVDPIPRSSEASLTSHDLLMREIKARAVVLKPPVIPADTEKEKAARDVIMDFIKSRPRLRSVLKRKLPNSPLKHETPVERLLRFIYEFRIY